MFKAKNLEIFHFFLQRKWLLLWLLWSILWSSWVDLVWLAALTAQTQVSDYRQLSDYTVQLQLFKVISDIQSSWRTNHIWGNGNGYD